MASNIPIEGLADLFRLAKSIKAATEQLDEVFQFLQRNREQFVKLNEGAELVRQGYKSMRDAANEMGVPPSRAGMLEEDVNTILTLVGLVTERPILPISELGHRPVPARNRVW